jgi:hypothetical protein
MQRKFFLITILTLLFAVGTFYLYVSNQKHVSVKNIYDRSFSSKVSRNAVKLYEIKESVDPSFGRNCIIPTNPITFDVVIPLVEKDLEVVAYTVKSIKTMVGHKLGTIYIVAPESKLIRYFANSYGCKFVLEDDILPASSIKKHGGWIIQQFLKLNADTIVENDHYLVVDADTIFLRPLVFIDNAGRYLVNAHWDYTPIRKKITALLLGNEKVFQYDFVCHNMLFSKKVLKSMKQHIEQRFQKSWDQAVLDLLEKEKDGLSGFSEYDLYTTYLTEFSGEKFKFVSNANITVYRNFLDRLEKIMPAYSAMYKSISLHHFVLFN